MPSSENNLPPDDTQSEPRTSPTQDNDPAREDHTPTLPGDDFGGDDSAAPLPGADLHNGYQRYEDFHLLGMGGVALVNGCRDPYLGREVALKVLRPKHQRDRLQRTRFVREARVMARIEHPGIVPVHELGINEAGNVYFTMKRVQGTAFSQILDGLRNKDPETCERYPLTRLIDDVFTDVCQAVAFAHSHGIIHRDLKPNNVLIGAFGEVQVMDWGLAKFVGAEPGQVTGTTPVDSTLDLEPGDVTLEGAIPGTPYYMAPEQALGKVDEQDERTDLYSLGILLYEMLTLERPFEGETAQEVLEQVVNGNIPTPRQRAPQRHIPRELDAICMKAIQHNPEDRYSSVSQLITDIKHYLDGRSVSVRRDPVLRKFWKACRRRPVGATATAAAVIAAVLVAGGIGLNAFIRYRTLVEGATEHRVKGSQIYSREIAVLRQLKNLRDQRQTKNKPPHEMQLERQARRLRRERENHYETAVLLYTMASGNTLRDPQRRALEEIFANRLQRAIMMRDYEQGERWLDLARYWLGSDFKELSPGFRIPLLRAKDAVEGTGRLSVTSTPEGARVTLWKLVPGDNAVLGPASPRSLGTTPIPPFSLNKGNYLLTLKRDGLPPVQRPLRIDHAETDHVTVSLPAIIPDGMVYVPEGAFYTGGPHAREYRLHEKDLPPFFIKKTEVTFREYMEYWAAPGGGARSTRDLSLVQLDQGERRFVPAWDESLTLRTPLTPDMPVTGIAHDAAARYCDWLSAKLNRPVTLPSASQWEKAARGADGRTYVWGNQYDPSFAFTLENRQAHKRYDFLAPVGSFPMDRSIYGALDLGGNVREWTQSPFCDQREYFKIKGASAWRPRDFLYCSYSSDPPAAPADVGFRYVSPLTEDDI